MLTSSLGSLVASWVGCADFLLGASSCQSSDGISVTDGCYKNYSDARQWRLPLGLQLMPAVPLAFGILLFPESPRWLLMKGRDEEGE